MAGTMVAESRRDCWRRRGQENRVASRVQALHATGGLYVIPKFLETGVDAVKSAGHQTFVHAVVDSNDDFNELGTLFRGTRCASTRRPRLGNHRRLRRSLCLLPDSIILACGASGL